jgi:hypothetical protein
LKAANRQPGDLTKAEPVGDRTRLWIEGMTAGNVRGVLFIKPARQSATWWLREIPLSGIA